MQLEVVDIVPIHGKREIAFSDLIGNSNNFLDNVAERMFLLLWTYKTLNERLNSLKTREVSTANWKKSN